MTTNARFSYTLRDGQGVETAATFYAQIADAALVTDASNQWQTLADLLDPITDAKIMHGTISYPVAMAGGKTAPTPDSRVEEVGILQFTATGSIRRYGAAIPAYSRATRLLDDSGTMFFAAALTLSGAGVLVRYSNAFYQPLQRLVDGLLSIRKRRAQLERVSIEAAL